MRRLRTVTAGLTALVLGGGLALVGATAASAVPAGHWGTFTVAGQSRGYTGTVSLPGFPETTFESNSRQSTVVSGASTWQGPSTGPGAVYGSSRGNTYLNQRPLADAPGQPSVTTYTFAEPTPGASSWSFVLGDVDADRATISAVTQAGAAATAADLGFSGAYNSCSVSSPGGWSCSADPDGTTGRDVPTWDPDTLTLTGNAGAVDTAGATAWFTPTVPLTSLTITYERRSGFPVYQTWFANSTAALTGTATLDGAPVPGATVTVTAPRGTVYTTTTAADGTYAFPQLPQIPGYTVTVTQPAGAEIAPDLATQTVSLDGTDGSADFPFTAPADTASIIGQVTDTAGNPAADVPVVITDPNDPANPIETVTNDDGYYLGSGLPPETPVTVAVDGADPVTVTTGEAAPAAPTAVPPIVSAAVSTVGGQVRLDGAPQAGVTVDLLDAAGTVVATTVTGSDGTYAFSAVAGTYTVRSALPVPDAVGSATSTPVTLTGGGAEQTRDFAFTTPPAPEAVTTTATGRVVDTDGAPVAGRTVTATPDEADSGAVPARATTGTDGGYTLEGLDPATDYTVSVAGSDSTVGFTSGPDDTVVVTVDDLVVAAAASPSPTPTATPTPTPTPTPTGTPTQTPTSVPVGSTGPGPATGGLAYTGADVGPAVLAAAVLVLLGAALLTVRSLRHRRRPRTDD